MLEVGHKAPDFELATDAGEPVKLSELRGRPVVVYFYPKDDTSGCTLEAKAFTEHKADFDRAGAVVIGISPDSVASHAKFRKKHALDLVLAADESKAAAEAYGVWVEKKMYGKTYMGVERSTFLVDAKGKLQRIWTKVKVPGHVPEVLEAVQALG
jgi:thioredoxin-dependent peroxiredoxin